jgi:ribonuclease HI
LKVFVNVDGLCEPVNPGGTATYGFIIRNSSDNIIAKTYGVVGKGPGMSNNVAEYAALCEALRFLANAKMTQSPIEVRSDSRLLVNQMAGDWQFRKGLYEEKYSEAKELAKRFGNISFKWVPREKNGEADALSREAYSRDRSDE